MFLVFTDEADQLSALLNLVQRFYELVCEGLNPIDVLVLNLDERLTDALLPVVNDLDVLLVLDDCLSCHCLDLLELFELVLVLLVNVVEVLACYDTLKALVSLLSLRVESCWCIVLLTINAKRAIRVNLLRLVKESVINDALTNVPFHVG